MNGRLLLRSGLEIRAWPRFRAWPLFLTLSVAAVVAGCASRASREPVASAPPASTPPAPRPGGYYKDDGPGIDPPADLELVPDATPRWEALHRFANRPYTVLGREYVPATAHRPYKERGMASWYGRKFHQQRTSIGESYDMYGMTAAHPTLPLPSYVRVTSVATGKSVVVRVNDRGPFLHGRIIDLSYTAALKLGYVNQGSALVEVEALLPSLSPESIGIMAATQAPSRSGSSAGPPAATVALAPVGVAERERDLPMRVEGPELYLQLGAFANLDNAQNFLSLMQFKLSGTSYNRDEISYTPRIRSRDNLFRVEIGPYATRSEAQRAAADLESRFGVMPSPVGP